MDVRWCRTRCGVLRFASRTRTADTTHERRSDASRLRIRLPQQCKSDAGSEKSEDAAAGLKAGRNADSFGRREARISRVPVSVFFNQRAVTRWRRWAGTGRWLGAAVPLTATCPATAFQLGGRADSQHAKTPSDAGRRRPTPPQSLTYIGIHPVPMASDSIIIIKNAHRKTKNGSFIYN